MPRARATTAAVERLRGRAAPRRRAADPSQVARRRPRATWSPPSRSSGAPTRGRQLPHGHGQRADAPWPDYGQGTVPYAQLFFDSTPVRHAASVAVPRRPRRRPSTYLWRVRAAGDHGALARRPRRARRRDALMNARNSAEVLMHPPDATEHFADPATSPTARDAGDIVRCRRAGCTPRRCARPPDGRAGAQGRRRPGSTAACGARRWPRSAYIGAACARSPARSGRCA